MSVRTLSAIIPVRNQPDTLDDLLTNLDAQSVPEGWRLEVICIDNASTDSTPDVIKRHNATYILETQLGPSIARNTGVAAAAGELLWFIDADVLPLVDDFPVRIVEATKKLDSFAGFGGPILLPQRQYNNPIAFADHMACWSAWSSDRTDGHSDFQPTSFICRKADFDAVGGFDTQLRVLEDWDLQMRLQNLESPSDQIATSQADDDDIQQRPIWFLQNLPVAHAARDTFVRTIKHSWYWGLPSRRGWFGRSGASVTIMEKPFLRWLVLPTLVWQRAKHPLKTAWQVSPPRALLSAPILMLTLLVWGIAVIVGRGQPDEDKFAPV